MENRNRNEDININEKEIIFENIWNTYDKKTKRKKALEKFLKLSSEDIEKIYQHVPKYVESTPEKKYRKDFITYLNQEAWNDEIISNRKLSQSERLLVIAEKFGEEDGQ